MRRLVLAAAVALCLVGSSASAASRPASFGVSDAQQLLDVLDAAGVPCWDPVTVPHANGMLSMVECSSGGRDQDTVLAVFLGFDVQGRAASYASQAGPQRFVVLGSGWVVRTSSGYGPWVMAVLGGTRVQ